MIVKISNLDSGRVKRVCVFGKSKQTLTLFRMDLFEAANGAGEQKDPPP